MYFNVIVEQQMCIDINLLPLFLFIPIMLYSFLVVNSSVLFPYQQQQAFGIRPKIGFYY